MPLAIRTIKKVADGSIKRVNEGVAANMVGKGLYVYADDGPDLSRAFVVANSKTLDKLEKRETPIVDFKKDLKPVKSTEAKSTTPKRIKKESIPKEQMDAIKAINAAQPSPAINTQADGFSNLVKHAKDRLKKTQTKIPLKLPEK